MLKAVVVVGGIVLIAGFWGGAALVTTAVLGIALIALWLMWHNATAIVPEMRVGVVYRRDGERFVRFLPAGHHWLRPFVEQVKTTIPLNPGSANGRCYNIQTSGGLPLTIEWTLSYTLNPFRIPAEKRPKLARSLPTKSHGMAEKHMNNVLRHILSEYTIDQLTQPGTQRRLERQVRQALAERLANAGFEISRVMIGAIDMPEQVTAALAKVHERQLQADNEAKALWRLQQVVSQFSEGDMERLMELERIHMLGQNGVTLMYAPGNGDGYLNIAGHAKRPLRTITN